MEDFGMKIFRLIPVVAFLSGTLLVAQVPDFNLSDVNASSPRFGATVSPRDYRHQVSAYYFGSAT